MEGVSFLLEKFPILDSPKKEQHAPGQLADESAAQKPLPIALATVAHADFHPWRRVCVGLRTDAENRIRMNRLADSYAETGSRAVQYVRAEGERADVFIAEQNGIGFRATAECKTPFGTPKQTRTAPATRADGRQNRL